MISVREFAEKNNFKVLTSKSEDKNIEGVYVCDMLSLVIANAEKNDAWVTIQNHMNIVAVSHLKECACIIVAEDHGISEEIIKKAEEENILIISSQQSIYEICCLLYEALK